MTPLAAYRRLSRQLFFDSTDMFYRVWARKCTPDSLWFDLPYSPRNREGAQALIEFYEDEWGSLYDYVSVPCGQTPHTVGRGMCQPYV